MRGAKPIRKAIFHGLCATLIIGGTVGCGLLRREPGARFTRVSLRRGSAAIGSGATAVNDGVSALTVPAGAATVYAVNATNPALRARLVIPSLANGAIWTLPNGAYRFAIVGYDAADMQSGPPICGEGVGDDGAYGGVTVLGGGSKSVVLRTTGQSCAAAPFGSGVSLSVGASVVLCDSSTNLAALTPTQTCADGGGGESPYPVAAVSLGSYTQDELGGGRIANVSGATTLGSGCVGYPAGAAAAASPTLGLPVLGDSAASSLAAVQLKLELVAFASSRAFLSSGAPAACPASAIQAVYSINHGLSAVNGLPTAPGSEPAITRTLNGTTIDISDHAVWVATDGVGRLFIRDVDAPAAGAVSAADSGVVAGASSAVANGSTSVAIKITLVDSAGVPIGGKTVSLASSRPGSDVFSSAAAVTNALGRATISVGSNSAGSSILSATDVTDGVALAPTATVQFTPLPP